MDTQLGHLAAIDPGVALESQPCAVRGHQEQRNAGVVVDTTQPRGLQTHARERVVATDLGLRLVQLGLAVRIMAAPPPALVARDVGVVRYLCCASAGFASTHGLPTSAAQLRQTPLITSGVVGRELRLAAYKGQMREEVWLEPTLILDLFPFLREALLGGLGVGLLPDCVVQVAGARRLNCCCARDRWGHRSAPTMGR